jgi:hypothetical protein
MSDDNLGCYTCEHSYEDNKVICCKIRRKPCNIDEIEDGENVCNDFADRFKRTHYR